MAVLGGGGSYERGNPVTLRGLLRTCIESDAEGEECARVSDPFRSRVNMSRMRQSRPDYGLVFQAKVLKNMEVVPSTLDSAPAWVTRQWPRVPDWGAFASRSSHARLLV